MDVVTFMAPHVAARRESGVRAVAAVHLRSARGRRPAAEVRGVSEQRPGLGIRSRHRRLGGPAGEILLSKETHRVALAINSIQHACRRRHACGWSMPAQGTTDAAYEGKDVKGALVLASGGLGQAWNVAARARGAAGVISTDDRALHQAGGNARRAAVGQHSVRRSAAVVRLQGDAARRRAAARRACEGRGHAARRHRDDVSSAAESHADRRNPRPHAVRTSASCSPRTCRSRARTTTPAAAARCWRPRWRCRTASAAARCRRRRGRSRSSGSTRSRGSRQWIKDHPDQLKGVVAMLSLDMTGEDTAKTGGTFLIEKQPDPSALWDAPVRSALRVGRGQGRSGDRCAAAS